MAKLDGLPVWERGPSMRRAVLVYTDRGQLIARRWPRRRGRRLAKKTLDQMDWFFRANLLSKFASPTDHKRAREMSQGTGFYPRDLIMSAIRGRLYWIALPDGKKVIPMAARENVSFALDFITEEEGALMVRSGSLWIPLSPGQEGRVLATQGAGQLPIWVEPGSGAFGFTPPSLNTWPNEVNVTSFVREATPFRNVTYHAGQPPTSMEVQGVTQTLPAGDQIITAVVGQFTNLEPDTGHLLMFQEAENDRLFIYGQGSRSTSFPSPLLAEIWSKPSIGFESRPFTMNQPSTGFVFLRAVRTGSIWSLQYSSGGGLWREAGTIDEVASNISVDQVGICTKTEDSNDTQGVGTVWHWDRSAA